MPGADSHCGPAAVRRFAPDGCARAQLARSQPPGLPLKFAMRSIANRPPQAPGKSAGKVRNREELRARLMRLCLAHVAPRGATQGKRHPEFSQKWRDFEDIPARPLFDTRNPLWENSAMSAWGFQKK
jgi:hypothetical protein